MVESVRDTAIQLLATDGVMTARRIAHLRYTDVAHVDPRSRYVEASRLSAPDSVLAALEDYLNAQPPGRPFVDYRPDIGPFLFPSPRTRRPPRRKASRGRRRAQRSVPVAVGRAPHPSDA